MQIGDVLTVTAFQNTVAAFLVDLQRFLFQNLYQKVGNNQLLLLGSGFTFEVIEVEAVGYVRIKIYPAVWAQAKEDYVYCRLQKVGTYWEVIEGCVCGEEVFKNAPGVAHWHFHEWTPTDGFNFPNRALQDYYQFAFQKCFGDRF